MILRHQAMGFVSRCGKGPMAAFLEGALGLGWMPSVEDFGSFDTDAIYRCQEFVAYLAEVREALEAAIKERDEKRHRAADAERANTIPGVPPAEPASPKPRRRKGGRS